MFKLVTTIRRIWKQSGFPLKLYWSGKSGINKWREEYHYIIPHKNAEQRLIRYHYPSDHNGRIVDIGSLHSYDKLMDLLNEGILEQR